MKNKERTFLENDILETGREFFHNVSTIEGLLPYSFINSYYKGKNFNLKSEYKINRRSKSFKTWKYFMYLIILYSKWISPWNLAFDVDVLSREVFVDCIFLFDIFIYYLTYSDDAEFEEKQKLYISIIDFFVSLPYIIIGILESYNFLKQFLNIIKLFRIIKVLVLIRKYKFAVNKYSFFKGHSRFSLKLFIIFYWFSITVHFITCLTIFFFQFDSKDEFYTSSWIVKDKKIDKSNTELYISALFFNFTIIITQGYGNIVPGSHLEKIICIFLLFFGNTLFARTVGKLIKLFSDLNEERDKKKLKQDYFLYFSKNFFFHRKYLEQTLNKNAKAELYHDGYSHDEIVNFFKELPDDLLGEIFYHIHAKFIKLFKLLQNVPKSFLAQIFRNFKFSIYNAGDQIYKAGDPAKEIFFIVEGTIILIDEKKIKDLSSKNFVYFKGTVFGEADYLKKQVRNFSAIARSESLVFKIEAKKFFEILKKYSYIMEEVMSDFRKKLRRLNIVKITNTKKKIKKLFKKRSGKVCWEILRKKVRSMFTLKSTNLPIKTTMKSKYHNIETKSKKKVQIASNFNTIFNKAQFLDVPIHKSPTLLKNDQNLYNLAKNKLEKFWSDNDHPDLVNTCIKNIDQNFSTEKITKDKILDEIIKELEERYKILIKLEDELLII